MRIVFDASDIKAFFCRIIIGKNFASCVKKGDFSGYTKISCYDTPNKNWDFMGEFVIGTSK